MTPFTYARATAPDQAVQLAGTSAAHRYLGGGTNLVDLMRETIERPDTLIDVTHLSHEITATPEGGLRIGGAATNTELAAHPAVREKFPALSRAILSGASGQIRNMATVAGNILQRTRCTYFYDESTPCNKRRQGEGCSAIGGFTRIHAILGTSPYCIATHPSDMAVALAAFDATVHLHGSAGARQIKLADLHRLPEDRPDLETNLQPGELITAIELPALAFGARSTYRKVRDRASYAFALVSIAAALDIGKDGTIADLRLAFGGVAPKPWRALRAEEALRGRKLTDESCRSAAEAELAQAKSQPGNAFKLELVRRLIPAVLAELQGESA